MPQWLEMRCGAIKRKSKAATDQIATAKYSQTETHFVLLQALNWINKLNFRQIEARRIELFGTVDTKPLEHIFVFFMLRIFQDLLQIVITSESTAIVWRAGVFARDALRILLALCKRHFSLESNGVRPSVAEVILISALLHPRWKPISDLFLALVFRRYRVERIHFGIRQFDADDFRASGRALRLGLATSIEPKCVQMAVGPTHSILNRTMQIKKGIVCRNYNPPPNPRIAVVECNFKNKTLCALFLHGLLPTCLGMRMFLGSTYLLRNRTHRILYRKRISQLLNIAILSFPRQFAHGTAVAAFEYRSYRHVRHVREPVVHILPCCVVDPLIPSINPAVGMFTQEALECLPATVIKRSARSRDSFGICYLH